MAEFQWKCAAAPAPRKFGVGAVFFPVMVLSMHWPWVFKRKIKAAEADGLRKNLRSHATGVRVFLVYWPVSLAV